MATTKNPSAHETKVEDQPSANEEICGSCRGSGRCPGCARNPDPWCGRCKNTRECPTCRGKGVIRT